MRISINDQKMIKKRLSALLRITSQDFESAERCELKSEKQILQTRIRANLREMEALLSKYTVGVKDPETPTSST